MTKQRFYNDREFWVVCWCFGVWAALILIAVASFQSTKELDRIAAALESHPPAGGQE